MFRLFSTMFRWIGLQLGFFNSALDKANDNMLKDPTLMREEFKKVKEGLKKKYKDMYAAITGMTQSRIQKEQHFATNTARLGLVAKAKSLQSDPAGKDKIDKIGVNLKKTAELLNAATAKMLARAKEVGITDVRDPAATDTEFIRHRNNRAQFAEQKANFEKELQQIEADLKRDTEAAAREIREINDKLIRHKAQLAEVEREINDIDGKAEDTIADILGAKQAKERDAVLAAIDTTEDKNRLANLERLRREAVAETMVANEMAGGTVGGNEYADYAAAQNDDDEINALLNPNHGKDAAPQRIADQLPEG